MPSHGIIDIIALPTGFKPFFTGDNGEASVVVQPSAQSPSANFMTKNGLASGNFIFQNGDAVLILSGGCRLPYVYSMATLPLIIDLTWYPNSEDLVSVPCGQLVFPNEGQEINFEGSNVDGVFIPSGGLSFPDLTANWQLCATLAEANPATVNQFYAPDQFNGEDLEIDVWLKVQHSLPLLGEV